MTFPALLCHLTHAFVSWLFTLCSFGKYDNTLDPTFLSVSLIVQKVLIGDVSQVPKFLIEESYLLIVSNQPGS